MRDGFHATGKKSASLFAHLPPPRQINIAGTTVPMNHSAPTSGVAAGAGAVSTLPPRHPPSAPTAHPVALSSSRYLVGTPPETTDVPVTGAVQPPAAPAEASIPLSPEASARPLVRQALKGANPTFEVFDGRGNTAMHRTADWPDIESRTRRGAQKTGSSDAGKGKAQPRFGVGWHLAESVLNGSQTFYAPTLVASPPKRGSPTNRATTTDQGAAAGPEPVEVLHHDSAVEAVLRCVMVVRGQPCMERW